MTLAMPSLFKRAAELQIGDTTISGLDIAFCIEKTLAREPNTAEFKIWNLNDRNRKYLRDQTRVPVTLKAGYEEAMGLLFQGDLSEAFSEREGPDWVTTIRSGEKAKDRQWEGADSLEWTHLPSPVPYHTFETPPLLK